MSTAFARQLFPLQLNPKTGEPFLRLPEPHAHIIVTPPRMADAPELVPAMNDPLVYRWLYSMPHPCTDEDALAWVQGKKAQSDELLQQLETAAAEDVNQDASLTFVGGCPVSTIREQRPDGTDVYIGNCAFRRASIVWERDDAKRGELERQNSARKPGDPEIVWSMGMHLTPSHHGRGIMSAVVRTLVEKWALPRMNARHICPSAFEGNARSMCVFLKSGFAQTRVVENVLSTKAKGEYPAKTWTLFVFEYQHL